MVARRRILPFAKKTNFTVHFKEDTPMARVKPLTEITLVELWRQVKQDEHDEESFWVDIKTETLRVVKCLLETSLEAEMIDRLQARWYHRGSTRRGYRNGYYRRNILFDLGLIENLRVPRTREPLEPSKVLERYRRRQANVNRLVRDMFLAGVSTRRVGEVLKPILGKSISAQTVSRITSTLDREVASFLNRPLLDCYRYLLLDGITLKQKTAAGVAKKLVLVAYGITENGLREIIAFSLGTAESEAQWEAFLDNLYKRGLEGKVLELIVTDGCPGLHKALERVYPYVLRQRCWAHKLRNVAAKLPRKIQAECLRGAKLIYLAQTEREARKRYREWAGVWQEQAPKAVACIGKDLEELVSFLGQPKDHWKKIRTTNAIERAFREIRRRTRPMSCFNNSASCRRIVYGVTSYLNAKWKVNPIPHFTQSS
jgi:putative transposase